MSASSSPTNPAFVPYQAYKSKRHSRNLSNSNAHSAPHQLPPIAKQLNGDDNLASLLQPPFLDFESGADNASSALPSQSTGSPEIPSFLEHSKQEIPTLTSSSRPLNDERSLPAVTLASPSYPASVASPAHVASSAQLPHSFPEGSSASPEAPAFHSSSKKVTILRRLPPKKSVLQPQTSVSSVPSSPLAITAAERNVVATPSSESVHVSSTPELHIVPAIDRPPLHTSGQSSQVSLIRVSAQPSSRSISLNREGVASEQLSAPSPVRKAAPYRPGFQPRGLYRHLTDEFIKFRKLTHEGGGAGGLKRIERTKLERRLEKLISLHFPHAMSDKPKEDFKLESRPKPSVLGRDKRRASSFFDFQSLRRMNIDSPIEIWKGAVIGNLDPTKSGIRAEEQNITPWQDDASVNRCPLCLTTFHPLTNRKHHCRLCGQIICSLPVKHPQRPALCSILFVVNSKTRQIEEVDEGVDYGVRRRSHEGFSGSHSQQEEEKFLKGVRVCRECRPILLRRQYQQQSQNEPPVVKLYDLFIRLEADIEESLPKFQELVMMLAHHDQPTREASAARKRLLDSFAQYDKISKMIRALPSPNGPGSSQDRVQAAILMRANLFLQKNMFPLQSLPAPRSSAKPSGSSDAVEEAVDTLNDMDSALANRLQPLLEQESLLESFITEAVTQRKFEDVKTLKTNLVEIRREIEKLLEEYKR